jgi:hypothetical protein
LAFEITSNHVQPMLFVLHPEDTEFGSPQSLQPGGFLPAIAAGQANRGPCGQRPANLDRRLPSIGQHKDRVSSALERRRRNQPAACDRRSTVRPRMITLNEQENCGTRVRYGSRPVDPLRAGEAVGHRQAAITRLNALEACCRQLAAAVALRVRCFGPTVAPRTR